MVRMNMMNELVRDHVVDAASRCANKVGIERDAPAPEKADIPPMEGFTLVVDGHYKTRFDNEASAKSPPQTC